MSSRFHAKSSITDWLFFAVPKVSIARKIGILCPIAYATRTSTRSASFVATMFFAIYLHPYAALRSTLVGSLPLKHPPPWLRECAVRVHDNFPAGHTGIRRWTADIPYARTVHDNRLRYIQMIDSRYRCNNVFYKCAFQFGVGNVRIMRHGKNNVRDIARGAVFVPDIYL